MMATDKHTLGQAPVDQIPHAISGEAEQTGKNYLEMASSMPMISGAFSYISSTYNSVKDTNETVAPLMDGVERSVSRVATAAYSLSKQVAGSNYLDNLACKGLDKNEISSVPLPDNTKVEKSYSETLWNNRFGQTIMNVSNKALDATVNAVDSYLTPAVDGEQNDLKDEDMSTRLSSVAGKARKRIIGMVSDPSLKPDQPEPLVVKELTSETSRWLPNIYKRLQKKPENESLIMNILRFSALITVGATLTFQAALEPNKPFIVKTFHSMFAFVKEASIKLLVPLKLTAEKAADPIKSASKNASDALLEKSKEAVIYAKGAGLQMSANAVTYAKNFIIKSYQELLDKFHQFALNRKNTREEPEVKNLEKEPPVTTTS